ncbi:hypothetical protein FOJ82_09730 [Tessaracoccus rhinocerotis]|uniref:DUF218 domain-containing protein n=1 Tax=Tessaracoccus rhinocerotis TaxID=1689449 RepID=A0A553K0S0_9ACTN|nr:ElyC/SanA/YdcF family protein [Tessaracoccus rhinocerotis]TRY18301.1 hypothetical protein FOJ82_09730 [Tessaracoccus rhinocerotis]
MPEADLARPNGAATAGAPIVVPAPRPRRWLRFLLAGSLVAGASLVAAVLFGAGHVAEGSQGRIHTVDDVPETPIAMVLGAAAHPDGRPSAFLAARLDLAVELYERGAIRAVLVSGDNLARGNFQTTVMREYLVDRGIPAAQVVEDPAGFDTYDSCVRARDVFGVEQMVIVSQEYHLARAITICNEVGIDAVGVGDLTTQQRFPLVYLRGEAREWLANLKMEWDLFSRREPQQDPYDPTLLEAAGVAGN